MKLRIGSIAVIGLAVCVGCIHSKSCVSCGDEPAAVVSAPKPAQASKALYVAGNHTEAPIEIGTPLASALDHVTFVSNDPRSVYFFFVNQLGLPEAQPMQNHPTYQSGAVTFGNLLVEFFKGKEPVVGVNAHMAFLNFEPQDLIRTPGELDRRHLPHGPPQLLNTAGIGNTVNALSTTLVVNDLGNDESAVRFYQSHVAVMGDRRDMYQKWFSRAHGGTLGIVGVREVDLYVPDLDAAKARWTAVFGEPRSENAWQLASGPLVKLTSDRPSNGKLIVEVANLDAARQALVSANALSKASTADDLEIEPTAIQSMEIHLVAAKPGT